jgi:membrane-associated phospholipid phosphatase
LAGRRALLLWSGLAVAAMFALGWAVGKRSTPLDRWFHRFEDSPVSWLLFFTDPWVLMIVLLFCVIAARYLGRRRLAVAMVVSPVFGIVLVELVKPVFGRLAGSSLAYPSGHTTTVVIVMGMFVLLVGARPSAVVVAAVVAILGAIGQGVTYHYFTDTVGALLLGIAVVCTAAAVTELDTRQPACDADHTPG